MRGLSLFQSARSLRPVDDEFTESGWDLCLTDPVRTLTAQSLDEVLPLIENAEQAALDGRYVALCVAYDAAPAFDAHTAHRTPGTPLAWAGIYDGPSNTPAPRQTPTDLAFRALSTRREHTLGVQRIRELIADGETYQVNYTIPFEATFPGDPLALFHDLSSKQNAGFMACVDMGDIRLLSLSPELFFLRRGGSMVTRPMKGTARRGRFRAEDERLARDLAANSKERAENVMIVDLLRNDLGRVARPGGVRVRRLFEVEPYPTIWQMTSTVDADLRPDISLADIFRALFPCGSVTGAPKIRTTQIIADLEPEARGYYCGAIGFLRPGGDCVFNVPIRTLEIRPGNVARFQVGGGITYGSAPDAEYDECLAKMNFLSAPAPDFRLLETMLLRRGTIRLLDRHLDRLLDSARRFGFEVDGQNVRRQLEAVARNHPEGRHKVRLLADANGHLEIETQPLPAKRAAWIDVAVAGTRVDSNDPALFHKTDRRILYDRARAERPDCFDVLLVNEHEEITEGTFTSVVARLDGALVTPPLQCGLLPGTFRQELVETGVVHERVLTVADLHRAEKLWFVNSVRGFLRARMR